MWRGGAHEVDLFADDILDRAERSTATTATAEQRRSERPAPAQAGCGAAPPSRDVALTRPCGCGASSPPTSVTVGVAVGAGRDSDGRAPRGKSHRVEASSPAAASSPSATATNAALRSSSHHRTSCDDYEPVRAARRLLPPTPATVAASVAKTPPKAVTPSTAAARCPATATDGRLLPNDAALCAAVGARFVARGPWRPSHVCFVFHGGGRELSLQQASTLRRLFAHHGGCGGDHRHGDECGSAHAGYAMVFTVDGDFTLSGQDRRRNLHASLQHLIEEADALRAAGSASRAAAVSASGLCFALHCLEHHPEQVLLAPPHCAYGIAKRLTGKTSDSGCEIDLSDAVPFKVPSTVAARPSDDAVVDETGEQPPVASSALPNATGEGVALCGAVGFVPVFFGKTPSSRPPRGRSSPPVGASAVVPDGVASHHGAPLWLPPADDAILASSPAPPAVSPFLSPAQQRTAAFIDRVQPFVCQQAAPQAATPTAAANAKLVAELTKLCDIYRATGDQWRVFAYSKAVTQLKKMDFEVTSVEQLRERPGFGEKILNKIDEILKTGATVKAQYLAALPEVHALQELTRIWGVGPSSARKLLQEYGVQSVQGLRESPAALASLSDAQRVGLDHFEDLLERIPRAEVAAIERVVCEALRQVGCHLTRPDGDEQTVDTVDAEQFHFAAQASWSASGSLAPTPLVASPTAAVRHHQRTPRRVDVVTCGSYRRGRPSSGDVDVLLCERSGNGHGDGLLTFLVERMRRNCECADGTTAGRFSLCKQLVHGHRSLATDSVHSDSWFGVVALPPCADQGSCPAAHRPSDGAHYARRLDLKLYPAQQYPFAILYFTGSDYFNRSMRLYAQKKGFSLSDKELRPVIRLHGDKVHDGAAIECKTERDIFVALGLPYRTPPERDLSS